MARTIEQTNMKMSNRSGELALAIELALSKESACLNCQLKPEEEIARNLEVSLREARSALTKLVEKGYLVRKRGSGTFVRRLPVYEKVIAGLDENAQQELNDMDLNSLVRQPRGFSNSRATRLQRMPKDAQWLQLSLWSNLYEPGQPHPRGEIVDAMVRRANSLGHNLSICSLTDSKGNALSPEQLTQNIERRPCDGFIVENWSHNFQKALGAGDLPVVWYQSSFVPLVHEPMVIFDTTESTSRAIDYLVDEGYEKIGLFHQHDQSGVLPMGRCDEDIYRKRIEEHGLDFTAVAESSIFSSSSALAQAQLLLEDKNPPQAVYVADDHLLPAFLEASRRCGRTIGEDLAVVTLSNKGIPLPPGFNWTRMEFDPVLLGETVVDILIKSILEERNLTPIQSFHARYIEGDTHKVTNSNQKAPQDYVDRKGAFTASGV